MSAKARTLFKGSAVRVTSFFIQIAVAFYMMPFLIHSLGDRMYGLWVFVGAFLGFQGFLDLGLITAVHRYVSRSIGKKDYEEANRYINSILCLYVIIAFVLMAVVVVAALCAPRIVENQHDALLFGKLVLIMGLGLATHFPTRVFSGILASHLRYDIQGAVEIGNLIVRSILIVYFLKTGHGIIALALITLLVSLVAYGTTIIITSKVIAPYLRISRRHIDITLFKPIFGYSSFSFLAHLGGVIAHKLDAIVITAFMGLAPVTIYSIAARLVSYFSDFIRSALGFMTPVFSQYEAKGNYALIREKFAFMSKIGIYLSVLIGGLLIIFGKSFIQRWVGEEYAQSYVVLLILVVPAILSLFQNVAAQLAYGISKHKFLAVYGLINSLANLAISIVLVQSMGLKGVALGTAIPMFVSSFIVVPVYICKLIQYDLKKYYLNLYFACVARASFILALFWYFAKAAIYPDYFNIVGLTAACVAFFGAAIFLTGFSAYERGYLMKTILKRG